MKNQTNRSRERVNGEKKALGATDVGKENLEANEDMLGNDKNPNAVRQLVASIVR
jgi:hypothetical protein